MTLDPLTFLFAVFMGFFFVHNLHTTKLAAPSKAAGPGEITLLIGFKSQPLSGQWKLQSESCRAGGKVTKVTTFTALKQKSHQVSSGKRSDLLSDLWRFVERVKVKDALRRSVMCRLVEQHLGFCSRLFFLQLLTDLGSSETASGSLTFPHTTSERLGRALEFTERRKHPVEISRVQDGSAGKKKKQAQFSKVGFLKRFIADGFDS